MFLLNVPLGLADCHVARTHGHQFGIELAERVQTLGDQQRIEATGTVEGNIQHYIAIFSRHGLWAGPLTPVWGLFRVLGWRIGAFFDLVRVQFCAQTTLRKRCRRPLQNAARAEKVTGLPPFHWPVEKVFVGAQPGDMAYSYHAKAQSSE
ncbi:MAG: hypothetical protein AAF822_14215 [Pseudomonadota bacterium]